MPPRGRLLRTACGLLIACLGSAASAGAQGPEEHIALKLGEVKSVAVDQIERVAIGNPAIVDFTIVSSTAG